MDGDNLLSICPELDKDSFKNDHSSLDLQKCDSLNNSFFTASIQHREDKKSTSVRNQLSCDPCNNEQDTGASTSYGLHDCVQLNLESLNKSSIQHQRILTTKPENDRELLESQVLSLEQQSAEDTRVIQILDSGKQENSESERQNQNTISEWISRRDMVTPPLDVDSLQSDPVTDASTSDGLQNCVQLDPGSLNESNIHNEKISISISNDHCDLLEQNSISSLGRSSLLQSTFTDADEYTGSRIPELTLKIFTSILTGRAVNLRILANTFNKLGMVSHDCVKQLEDIREDPNETQARIITENIEKHVTTLQLVYVLHQNNFTHAAQDLFSFHVSFAEKSRSREVSRKIVGERRKIQLYFKQIKQDVHKLLTSDPYAEVGEIGKRMLRDIEQEEKPGRRRFLCDKYICLKAAEIDAHTNQTDNVDPKGKPFQEIEAVITESSCPEISLILMLGRQADISSSLGTSPDDGENFLVDAFMWQNTCERCIEATDMIYKSVVFNLLQFQRTKDKKYQKRLFHQAEMGLDSLSEESDDVRLFWSRLFNLRKIFCHLGIGKRGEIIEGCEVSPESLKVVERMFQEDKLEGLEHRRKMMYGIAVTRFCHLRGAIGKAKEIIEIVMDFAREGKYTEKGNVAVYQEVLKNIDEYGEDVVILSDEYLFRTISPIYSRQSSRSSTTDTNTSSEIIINHTVLFESSSSDGFGNHSDSDGPPCEFFSSSSDQKTARCEKVDNSEVLKIQDTNFHKNAIKSTQSDDIHLQSDLDEINLSSLSM